MSTRVRSTWHTQLAKMNLDGCLDLAAAEAEVSYDTSRDVHKHSSSQMFYTDTWYQSMSVSYLSFRSCDAEDLAFVSS